MRSFPLPFFVAVLALFFLAGCGGGGGGGGGSSSTNPGGPALSFIDQHRPVVLAAAARVASASAPVALAVSDPADFEEGNLPATTTYLFELHNAGNTPIRDIVVKAYPNAPGAPDYTQLTPQSVVVAPATIGILQPAGVSSLTQIIQVTVVHGRNPSGIGNAALLDPGRFVFRLEATGDTAAAGATIACNVQVANFSATLDGNIVLDQFSGTGTPTTAVTPDGNYSIPLLGAYANTQPRVGQTVSGVFTNTGNVPVTVTRYIDTWNVFPFSAAPHLAAVAAGTLVPVGGSTPVSGLLIVNGDSFTGGHVYWYLSVDPAGVVTSGDLAPSQADGLWWGCLYLSPSVWN